MAANQARQRAHEKTKSAAKVNRIGATRGYRRDEKAQRDHPRSFSA